MQNNLYESKEERIFQTKISIIIYNIIKLHNTSMIAIINYSINNEMNKIWGFVATVFYGITY